MAATFDFKVRLLLHHKAVQTININLHYHTATNMKSQFYIKVVT